jgi:hypothetical protein
MQLSTCAVILKQYNILTRASFFIMVFLCFYCPTVSQAVQLIFLLVPTRFSPLPISAITGTGTGDLLDLVCSELTKFEVWKLVYQTLVA